MKSAKECLRDNDFVEALSRLENTSIQWVAHWWECCCTIFERNPYLANQYRKDRINFTFRPIENRGKLIPIYYYNGKEIYTNGVVDLLDSVANKCYLFRFFDADDNLVYSKVGTSTRKVIDRIKQELRSYEKKGVVSCVVDRVYDCGDKPPEGMESYFRAMYIRDCPQDFVKNDRFFRTAFDLEQADNFYAIYTKTSQ